MSTFRLYARTSDWYGQEDVVELNSVSLPDEKSIQKLFENNLHKLIGVHCLETEFPIPSVEGEDRFIDTIGIDDQSKPVVIEYKNTKQSNPVSQVMSYMSRLLKSKRNFISALRDHPDLYEKHHDKIRWTSPRAFCISPEFKIDDLEHANDLRGRHKEDIQLIRIRFFGSCHFQLEYLGKDHEAISLSASQNLPAGKQKPKINDAKRKDDTGVLEKLLLSLESYLSYLSSNKCRRHDTKHCINYYRESEKNSFLSVVKRVKSRTLLLYARINPETEDLEDGFTTDMRNKRHWGNGHLQIRYNEKTMEKAKPLIHKAYSNPSK